MCRLTKNILAVLYMSCLACGFNLSAAAHTATAPVKTKQKSKFIHCPAIPKIYHSAEDHWGTSNAAFRSLDTSFSHKLKTFLGAQWQGINIGHILCVYQPIEPGLFKVTLLYGPLALQPKTKNWKKNKFGGYDCISTDVAQCPFIRQPHHISKESLEDQALKLYDPANNNDNNPDL